MGQKVNPVGLRLGINRGWDSVWYAKKKDFGNYLIEDFMVRHAASEALGAIVDRTAIETLSKFVDDTEPVISESCEVALDLLEWVQSREFEYH